MSTLARKKLDMFQFNSRIEVFVEKSTVIIEVDCNFQDLLNWEILKIVESYLERYPNTIEDYNEIFYNFKLVRV